MKTTITPSVSVCLPVYNGERHLRTAVDSILMQTHNDLELVITDNASTDGTAEICREYVARDPRVRYYRAPKNRGLAWNFNSAFRLAIGRYLVWIGHDDIMGRDYLGRCVAALDSTTDAVLCFSNSRYIDDAGDPVSQVNLDNSGADATPSVRFSRILYDAHCDPICGVMRRDVLKQTHLHGPYADSDRVLLAELGLRGRFQFLEESLYCRRMHQQQATARCQDHWSRTLVFDPSKADRIHFPWLREAFDLGRAICQAPLGAGERHKCCKVLYWWLLVQRDMMRADALQGWQAFLRRLPTAAVAPSAT